MHKVCCSEKESNLSVHSTKYILVGVDVIAVTTQFVEQFVPNKQKTIRNWNFYGLLYISNKQIAYNISNYGVSLVAMNANNLSCSILFSLQINNTK